MRLICTFYIQVLPHNTHVNQSHFFMNFVYFLPIIIVLIESGRVCHVDLSTETPENEVNNDDIYHYLQYVHAF